MASDQQFCLRWNNHQSTLVSIFDTLLENGSLVDCTLAAEGQSIKAHKVVLSACSPYFEVLMNQHYEQHPIIILKDVKFQEMKAMVDYMYRGEVNISQDQLSTFLKAAESLQIKGLSDGGGGETDSRDVGSTTPKRAEPPPKKIQSLPTPQPRSEPRKFADNSPVPSREGSISPSLRKRRRVRRPSHSEDSNDIDSASNTSDILSQGQSAPTNVPSIPPVVPIPVAPIITKQQPIESEEGEPLSRLDTLASSTEPSESGLVRTKIEPNSEGLIEPKTEYMDYLQNENSVEDLTLDDDDDDDDDMDMSRPGTSQGSNQGFLPWQLAGNQSGSEEVFMGSQDGISQGRRDSQDILYLENYDMDGAQNKIGNNNCPDVEYNPLEMESIISSKNGSYQCPKCDNRYCYVRNLKMHLKYECGVEPQFQCSFCPHRSKLKGNLMKHIRIKHRNFVLSDSVITKANILN